MRKNKEKHNEILELKGLIVLLILPYFSRGRSALDPPEIFVEFEAFIQGDEEEWRAIIE